MSSSSSSRVFAVSTGCWRRPKPTRRNSTRSRGRGSARHPAGDTEAACAARTWCAPPYAVARQKSTVSLTVFVLSRQTFANMRRCDQSRLFFFSLFTSNRVVGGQPIQRWDGRTIEQPQPGGGWGAIERVCGRHSRVSFFFSSPPPRLPTLFLVDFCQLLCMMFFCFFFPPRSPPCFDSSPSRKRTATKVY